MNYIEQIINSVIESFDFSFCVTVNIATYLIIKLIDELNGSKRINTWTKRLVLVFVIVVTGAIWYYDKSDLKTITNSAILAPVFWSWIAKPICDKLGIDYKKVKN